MLCKWKQTFFLFHCMRCPFLTPFALFFLCASFSPTLSSYYMMAWPFFILSHAAIILAVRSFLCNLMCFGVSPALWNGWEAAHVWNAYYEHSNAWMFLMAFSSLHSLSTMISLNKLLSIEWKTNTRNMARIFGKGEQQPRSENKLTLFSCDLRQSHHVWSQDTFLIS